MTYREVIITGGRNYDDWAMLQDVLNFIQPDVLIQGGAEGADKMARDFADINGTKCITIEANWKKHGKSAGPIRNIEMLTNYPNAIVVAFPGGKGTANCIREAYVRNRIILQVHA